MGLKSRFYRPKYPPAIGQHFRDANSPFPPMDLPASPITANDQLTLNFDSAPQATSVVPDSEGSTASDLPDAESEMPLGFAVDAETTRLGPAGTAAKPAPLPPDAELEGLKSSAPDLPKPPKAAKGRKKKNGTSPPRRKVRMAPTSPLNPFVYGPSDESVGLELDENVLAAAEAGLAQVETGVPTQPQELEDSQLHGLLKVQPLVALLAKLGAGQLDEPLTVCVRAFFEELITHETPTDPVNEDAYYRFSRAVRLLVDVKVSWLTEVLRLTAKPFAAASISKALRTYLNGHEYVEQRKALEKMARGFAFLIDAGNRRTRRDAKGASGDAGGKTRSSPVGEPFTSDEDSLDSDTDTTFDVGPARRKNRLNPIPIAVQRAINQVLTVEQRNYLTSHERVLLRDELLLEGSRHKAVLAACLWGGLWSPSIDSWVAFQDVETALSTPDWDVSVIAQPLAFLVANRAQASLPKSLARVAATHLYLPIAPNRLGADALAAKALERAGSLLFDRDDLRGLHGRILEFRVSFGAEFTTRAVQAQLKKALREVSGDEGLSALLHGVPIPTHLVARASYRRWTLRGLASAFDEACSHLEHQLRWGTTHWRRPDTASVLQAAPAGIDWDARVGSLRCPDVDEARDMTRSLRRGLATPPAGHPHPTRVVEIHRRLLTHTLTMLIWAVAARPGDSALKALQSPVGDTVLLEEKATTNSDPRLRKRAVRLCPMAVEQLHHWRAHRDFVLRSFPTSHREPPLFFDVDMAGNFEPISHRRYKRLADHYLCRSNAGRHALTSGLIDLGLPATRVNVLLGHSLPGEEVGAPFHSGWPLFSDEELLLVDAHLKRIGFEVRRGYRSRGRT